MRKTIERYCIEKNCLNLALKDRKRCSKCCSRRYKEKHPVMYAYHKLKSKAKKRRIAFDWSYEDFKQFCKDTNYLQLRGMGADDYTIDRPNEKEGYHKNNVQLMKRGDNTRKYYNYLRSGASWAGMCPRQPGDPF